MSKKGDSKPECPNYMFNIDFILKEFLIFDDKHEEGFQKLIRFRMMPGVCLDITDDEFIEQINCSKPVIKNCMFSLSDEQLKTDLRACIVAYKTKCSNATEEIQIGNFKVENLQCCFSKLKNEYNEKLKELKGEKCPQFGPPAEKTMSQLAQLVSPTTKKPVGSLYFSLHMTCFGPFKKNTQNASLHEEHAGFISDVENEKECKNEDEDCFYDQYVAQINGNSLIVRVPKNNPYLVTQVFDSSTEKLKDTLTIRGCEQQIDFQFPSNFMCCMCKQKYGKCNCKANSSLTEFQRKTSCYGNSYKNNGSLPAIRGNLKYPGRFDDQSVKFDVQDHCTPIDATEKYLAKPAKSRGACIQVDEKNLHRVVEGLCPIPQGIQVCNKGCDDDTDVFKFKINRKRVAKSGKISEVELELRTPHGPSVEIPKMETREIQVNEIEFVDMKKAPVKGKQGLKAPAKSLPIKSTAAKSLPAKKK